MCTLWPQVRLFDGQRVVRVKPGRVLAPGDMLLYPRDLLAGQRALPGQGWGLSSSEHSSGSQRLEHGSSSSSHQAGEGGRAASHATASSSGCSLAATQLPHRSLSQHAAGTQLAASPAPVAPAPVHPGQAAGLPPLVKAPGLVDPHTITPALMRSWVLEATNDIIFINKPAGVPVQVRGALGSMQAHASYHHACAHAHVCIHSVMACLWPDCCAAHTASIARNRAAVLSFAAAACKRRVATHWTRTCVWGCG